MDIELEGWGQQYFGGPSGLLDELFMSERLIDSISQELQAWAADQLPTQPDPSVSPNSKAK